MLFLKTNKSLMSTAVTLLLGLGLTAHEQAGAFELLTAQEIAAVSQSGYVERQTADPQGPRIEVKAPSVSKPVNTPFNIEIMFSPQGDAKINPDTLRIKYGWFDVTERVIKSGQAHISPNGIKVQKAEIEKGNYDFTISIQDSKERVGIAQIKVEVL
jgi:hypothetical protein